MRELKRPFLAPKNILRLRFVEFSICVVMLTSLRPRMSSSVSGVAPDACAPVSAITLSGIAL